MKYPKYVYVSPDAPDEFWDPKLEMWFRKADGIIELKDGLNAAIINRYLRFNYLFDGTSLKEPGPEKLDAFQSMITKTPAQLLREVELQERLSKVVPEEDLEPEDSRPQCPYCGKRCVPKGLPNHMRFCKENPENKKDETPEEKQEEIEEMGE